MLTFLIVGAGLLVVIAVRETKKFRIRLAKSYKQGIASRDGKNRRNLLTRVISVFVISVQVSELAKALDHITFTNIAACLLLLAILAAGKSGMEDELF